MATVNTIGTTGRDYSTLQAWEDSIPATPTGGYEGHCYNDSEFTAKLVIAGHTTSAANYILLTAAAGQSFQDHASVRSNALFYDQTKGVGLAANPFAANLLQIDDEYVTVSRMQVKRTGASYSTRTVDVTTGVAVALTILLKDCIFQKGHNGTETVVVLREQRMVNCVVYDTGTGASTLLNCAFTAEIINCTIARTGAAAGTGITAAYATPTITNCAVFNSTTNFSGTMAGDHNCTDSASAPGSSNQVSKTFANQFENTASDFRIKTGADCINTGLTNATYSPNDISGTVRGSGTAGDIGAWEFVSAAVAAPMMGRRVYILP